MRILVVGLDGWLSAGVEALIGDHRELSFAGSVFTAEEVTPEPGTVAVLSCLPYGRLAQAVRRLTANSGRVVILAESEARALQEEGVVTSPAVLVLDRTAPPSILIDALRSWAAEGSEESVERSPRNPARLSAREIQVLTLTATGATAAGVAVHLGIKTSTVDDYLRRIRIKYLLAGRPAPTKVHLHQRAVEDGLISASRHQRSDGPRTRDTTPV
jgi:DNA-binding NarL/FixJ family response regulator